MLTKPKSRILIVDDHAVLRAGLRAIIETTEDLTVCGEAENGEQALSSVSTLKPNLAIVDISLKNSIDGIELTKRLVKKFSGLPVLILSMHEEQSQVTNALAAGARGYVVKTEDTSNFLTAIRCVLQGDTYLSESVRPAQKD